MNDYLSYIRMTQLSYKRILILNRIGFFVQNKYFHQILQRSHLSMEYDEFISPNYYTSNRNE